MIVGGATLRPDNVRLLASMLDGELAAKLERAVMHENSIVALTLADRETIVAALEEEAPTALLELHSVLVKQIAQQRRKEAQEAPDTTQSGTRPAAARGARRLTPASARGARAGIHDDEPSGSSSRGRGQPQIRRPHEAGSDLCAVDRVLRLDDLAATGRCGRRRNADARCLGMGPCGDRADHEEREDGHERHDEAHRQ